MALPYSWASSALLQGSAQARVLQKEGVPYWDRIEGATKTGLLFGSAVGAVRGSWDFHVERTAETTLQGMAKTATTLASSVVFFGGMALTYAVAEAGCEAVRGVADWKNGALAGLAAGSIVGLRAGKVQPGANAGMLFCAASIAMDLSNGRLRTNPFSNDHAPSNPYQGRLSLPRY